MTEAMQRRMAEERNDEIVRDFLGTHLDDLEVFAHGAAKEALYREFMQRVDSCSKGQANALVPRHP